MLPALCLPPRCGDVGQAATVGRAQRASPWGTVQGARTASTAAGRVALDTSAAGWPCWSCLRAPLSLQALLGAAAAQLPPALCVLHGDGGAPLHVRLRVLPGQCLGRLRGWHARRRQLRAGAPLCHRQRPQEEAAPATAGPGEPRGEGAESRSGPLLATTGLHALGHAGERVCESLGNQLAELEGGTVPCPCTSQAAWPATSVLRRVVPHRAAPGCTAPFGAGLCHAVLHTLTPLPCSRGSG